MLVLSWVIVNEPPQKAQADINKQEVPTTITQTESIAEQPQPQATEAPTPVVEPPKPVPATPKAIGQDLAARRGWTGTQWQALEQLWHNESGWNPTAKNRSSGACGIVQAYPCSKLGANWSDPTVQIEWGLEYIANRYGTPSRALAFWLSQSPHWY